MARFSLAAVGAVALAALAAADGISGTATMTESSPSGGTCSFSNYSLPPGVSGVGVGPANWANGSKCGSCLQVDGPRGSTKVMITDSCPSCTGNRLNLLADAYKAIAQPNDGIIQIYYTPVSCGIGNALSVRNKEGTSKYYFAMQVLDANYPVLGLEVSTDNLRTWQTAVRKDYNYFEKADSGGYGQDSLVVRITCSNGRQVIMPDVPQTSKTRVLAPVNC